MEVTKKQAEALAKIGVRCFCITTGKIDYEENPILSEEYDCTVHDYDLPKIGKDLLAELFEKNACDGKLAVQSFRSDYIGKYVYMSRGELENFRLEAITENDGIFKQLEKSKSATEKIVARDAGHPRKMKRELAENEKKIGSIKNYISRYNG